MSDLEPEAIRDPVQRALAYAGGADGSHHDHWVVDQMVRALTNCPIVTESFKNYKGVLFDALVQGESAEYKKWVADLCNGEDGPNTYNWDIGIAP